MPSFADLIDAEVVTEEQLWNVALYVRSLAPEEPPVAREVIRARRVDGGLPAGVDDEAWADVERFYVPLVGQVIVEPRWFAPRVDGVWVQALHDGREVVLRLTWSDPSESPDPAWDEWRARMASVMLAEAPAPAGAAAAADTAATADTDAEPDTTSAAIAAPAAEVGPAPDVLVVQFPVRIPEGMERPYFLMGDDSDPVYLWRWESGAEGAREALGRGMTRIEPLAGAQPLAAEAVFEEGQWRLLVRREMAAGEVENRLAFEEGRPIPMALFAWDGDNGESGTRGAVGTWYFLVLEEPGSSSVYVVPLAAALLTAGLGVVLVARAQRRARENREPS
jgi:DMSO reductase family type II enzyme heme b subunit